MVNFICAISGFCETLLGHKASLSFTQFYIHSAKKSQTILTLDGKLNQIL